MVRGRRGVPCPTRGSRARRRRLHQTRRSSAACRRRRSSRTGACARSSCGTGASLPPHADSKNKLLGHALDYARYLMLSLSEDLVEMVDVDWPTWVVLEALAVAWCGVVAVNDGPSSWPRAGSPSSTRSSRSRSRS